VTTPTGPVVATASVTITPNTTQFTPQLQAALQRAVSAVSDAADRMGDQIAQGVTSGVARARLALATLTEGLDQRVRVTVNTVGSLETGLLGLGASVVKAAAVLGSLGLAAGSAAGAIGGLVGILSQLSGIAIALPAAVGSAALIMGTFKVAVQGVGEAIGAAVSGDLEGFVSALKELTPAAQQVAMTFFNLKTRIDTLKDATQEAFFAPLAKDFSGFVTEAVGLGETALPRVAAELGKIGGEFFNVARQGTFFQGLRDLVDQTVGGLQRWKGVTGELANALGSLFSVGSGFAGDLIAGVGVLIQRFSEWINTAARTGELQARLQAAIDAFAQLGRIVGNLGDIFGAFWRAAGDAGVGFLNILESVTEQIAVFLNSDVGQSGLQSLMQAASTAATVLFETLELALPIVGQMAMLFGTVLAQALRDIQPGLTALITGFGQLFTAAAPGITDAISRIALSFSQVLQAISPLLPVIGQFVGLLASNFATVIDIAAQAFISLASALQPILPTFLDLMGQGLTVFVQILGSLITGLQPLIPVILTLATTALGALLRIFEALLPVVDAVIPVIVQLGEQVGKFLAGRIEALTDLFVQFLPVVVDLAKQGFEILAAVLPTVTGLVKELLPPIIDLARQIGSALAPILPALAEAFREIFQTLRPVLPQLAEMAGGLLVTIARLFTSLVEAILPLVPPLLEIGTEILRVLVPAFDALLQAIIPVLPVISDLAVRLLREALLPILQAILPIIPLLVDALVKLLPSFVDLIPPLVEIVIALTPIITAFAALANLILQVVVPPLTLIIVILNEFRAITLTLLAAQLDALLTVVRIVFDGIVTAVKIAWTILKGIFDVLISLLQGDFSEAWRRLQRVVEEVWGLISGFVSRTLNEIIRFITEWGQKLWNAAWNALTSVAGVFSSKFAEFVQTAKDKVTDVITAFDKIPGAVGDIFKDAGSWLYSTGLDIIQGLIDGVVAKAKDIGGIIKDKVVDPIKGFIQNPFGIMSPSRWMMAQGRFLVDGLAVGLEDNTGKAVQATLELVNSVKKPVSSGAFEDLSGVFPATVPMQAMSSAVGGDGTSSVITFGPGAVMVSFEGVVPSEADALRTGRAVGRGIADVMAERDARLAVRVM
jgi:phage-related protein